MFKIVIEWDVISPFLKFISGIVKVYHRKDSTLSNTILISFKVTKEVGSIGYSSEEGIPCEILNAIKPQLDIMVRSFFDGVNLSQDTFQWVFIEDVEEGLVNLKSLRKSPNKRYKKMHKSKGSEIFIDPEDTIKYMCSE
jgi:hypothetical protein